MQYWNFCVGLEGEILKLKTQKESQLKSVWQTPEWDFRTKQGFQQNGPLQIMFKILWGFKITKKTFSKILGWVRPLRHTPNGASKPATLKFPGFLVALLLKKYFFSKIDRSKLPLKFCDAFNRVSKCYTNWYFWAKQTWSDMSRTPELFACVWYESSATALLGGSQSVNARSHFEIYILITFLNNRSGEGEFISGVHELDK